MKLIADSGSTKTTWVILDDKKVKETITTCGLNPYFHTSASVEAVFRADLAPITDVYHIDEIHFYGAGCSTNSNNNLIRDALQIFFKHATISVYHDILGAARALFGDGKGIACILGTGCNSCYYDGKDTFHQVDSLGYLFGDEGAGSYLGKLFMSAYLKKELPEDLREAFDMQYGLTLEDILNALYNKPYPNRFLASFSLFLGMHRGHPFVNKLIIRSFQDFFEAHIQKYPACQSTPVGFIGSIAYHYKEILETVAKNAGISITCLLPSPIEGLIAYHR